MTERKTIKTPEFRLSWPKLNKPDEESGKFQCTAIFEPGTDIEALKAVANEAITEFFGDKVPKNLFNPFMDGNEKVENGGGPEYVDATYVNFKTQYQPTMLDTDGEEIIDPMTMYAGCYCRAIIHAYAYDNKTKGVGFTLHAVKKTRDGERLGGKGMNANQARKAFEDE